MKRVLIVRLDAIGDYILWRNCLRFLRNCARYRDAHITVLGNPAWRNLAESFDADCADEWVWAENRNDLFRKPVENLLPHCVWHRRVAREQGKLRDHLRALGFNEVISPCAFPDPQLDELVRGIAPVTRIAASVNEEFAFLKNRAIAAELAGEPCDVALRLDLPNPPTKTNRVLFFTGASHWTRLWPRRHWRKLAEMLPAGYKALEAPLNGTLADFARLVASCAAVVTNDTMALHLAAALDVPAVVLVNGISGRGSFWPYPASLGKRIAVVGAETGNGRSRPFPRGFAIVSLLSTQLVMWRNLATITTKVALSALVPLLEQAHPC